MFGWMKNQAFNLKQLDNSITYIESFALLERWELIDKLNQNIAGALQKIETGEMTLKDVHDHLQHLKNDLIKELGLTDERDANFSIAYISLIFFRALLISDAPDGKKAMQKIVMLLVKGKDSAAKSYILNLVGVNI
jgi:hypothetical protein